MANRNRNRKGVDVMIKLPIAPKRNTIKDLFGGLFILTVLGAFLVNPQLVAGFVWDAFLFVFGGN